jgi:hypothetical protein
MKEQPNDEKLGRLLREWRTDAPLPPRFQESVWRRIESAEKAPATRGWLPDWLVGLFARPAYVTVCATVLIIVGVSAGLWRGGHDAARMDQQLSQRYVASVNPYEDQR